MAASSRVACDEQRMAAASRRMRSRPAVKAFTPCAVKRAWVMQEGQIVQRHDERRVGRGGTMMVVEWTTSTGPVARSTGGQPSRRQPS